MVNLLHCMCVLIFCVCCHLRVDFKDKVFLLFELWDGLQHVAHGQDGTAVRSAVLDMRRTLLTVIEQHATCDRKCVWVRRAGHRRGSRSLSTFIQPHLFWWPGRWCRDLSSCLCCSGPAERQKNTQLRCSSDDFCLLKSYYCFVPLLDTVGSWFVVVNPEQQELQTAVFVIVSSHRFLYCHVCMCFMFLVLSLTQTWSVSYIWDVLVIKKYWLELVFYNCWSTPNILIPSEQTGGVSVQKAT